MLFLCFFVCFFFFVDRFGCLEKSQFDSGDCLLGIRRPDAPFSRCGPAKPPVILRQTPITTVSCADGLVPSQSANTASNRPRIRQI